MRLIDTGRTAQDIKDLVSTYMIDTYERYDFVAEYAKDQHLYDSEGERYLDFYAGIAVNSAGNCNPRVVDAVVDEVQTLMQTFNYPYTIPQALLAEKVCTTIGMDKIFYQNSGTEANEAMIKMARKYGIENYGPNRYHIVTAKMGFHGRTFGSMSATGQPGNGCQVGFGPMTYGFSYAPFNDLQAFKDACTENTIAIMVEPVQGEGGVHPATQEFMQGLRAFCDEREMLLLIDEVQTGWCRTGKVMSYMHYDIKPDIVSMAKALGGGMPIGAICATNKVATAFSPGSHGSTFGGHPVCCAAALAQVEELLSRDLAGNAAKREIELVRQRVLGQRGPARRHILNLNAQRLRDNLRKLRVDALVFARLRVQIRHRAIIARGADADRAALGDFLQPPRVRPHRREQQRRQREYRPQEK